MNKERDSKGRPLLPEEPGAERTAGQVRKKKKKSSLGWRIALLVLVVLILLLAVSTRLFPQILNPDRIARTFRYMGLRDQNGYGHISYDSKSASAFAAFDDGLLVAGENGVTLFALNGEQKAFVQGALPTPVLCTGGESSVCFSPGSSYGAAIGRGGSILLDQTFSGSFLDADVSEDGYLCQILTESGYKSVATVLNRNQDAVFRFSSRTRYLNACAVSEGGDWLALAALGEEDGAFRTVLTVLDTDVELSDLEQAESSVPQTDLGNQVIYDLTFLGSSRICAVGQDSVLFLDGRGNLLNTISLEDSQLLDYSFCDRDGVVLCLAKGTAGESGKVMVLDPDGDVRAEREINARMLSVSAAGKYVALLTDSYVEILDRNLESFNKAFAGNGAFRVIARPDGTAFLIGSNRADLYIP